MRRLLSCLVAVLAPSVLAGCVSLPEDGPVVQGRVVEQQDARRASDIDAQPPRKGASRTEVVTGFLDAMTSWPIRTNVAKQFLTDDAADQWEPERGTVVYTDARPARDLGGDVRVQLTTAARLDAVGAWHGAVPETDLTLSFQVTVEDGQYRITDPPNARIVPATWFQQRYRQVSLYYFDPLAKILVPEPVFVPEGAQLATTLVSALLSGPPPRVRGIVRTFIPSGLSVGLSVPVDVEGIADVNLVGNAPKLSSDEAELLLDQLAWTLRQDSTIRAIRVRIGDTQVPVPGGASTYPVDSAQDLDPAGDTATSQLFALSGGRLLSGGKGGVTPVTGAFGRAGADLVSVATTTDGEHAAAVDRDGRRVRLALVDDPSKAAPQTLLTSSGTFARPTWDHAGRLWLLERRGAGAVVWTVEDGRPRQVEVPGITGQRARQLLVSRDGTRVVGVVRTGQGDELRGARVRISGRGQVASAGEPWVVRPARDTRVVDLAWTSPIRVAMLTSAQPRSLYEVDVVPVDGSSLGVDTLSTIVPGHVLGLAGAPTAGAATYAVFADRYTDIVTQDEYDAGSATLSDLDYAG
ncbi:MAG TPA: LpqB family beta-propeller domain-containing protein [Nocardioides sp.]|nr:LpqB family beta-propeller domain-containing protein [Nocardioides sp.]